METLEKIDCYFFFWPMLPNLITVHSLFHFHSFSLSYSSSHTAFGTALLHSLSSPPISLAFCFWHSTPPTTFPVATLFLDNSPPSQQPYHPPHSHYHYLLLPWHHNLSSSDLPRPRSSTLKTTSSSWQVLLDSSVRPFSRSFSDRSLRSQSKKLPILAWSMRYIFLSVTFSEGLHFYPNVPSGFFWTHQGPRFIPCNGYVSSFERESRVSWRLTHIYLSFTYYCTFQ